MIAIAFWWVCALDAKLPHRGSISVTIGDPIWPQASDSRQGDDEKQRDNWATALALRDEARAFISRYSGEPLLDRE